MLRMKTARGSPMIGGVVNGLEVAGIFWGDEWMKECRRKYW